MSVFSVFSALFCNRERFLIEGIMPERALLRLKRAQISVYNVKKLQKNQIQLSVSKKDSEKVFAIFPNVCYNRNEGSAYALRPLGAVGIAKVSKRLKNRVGLLLGGLLFCATTAYFDGFIFGVEFIGTRAYARETHAALLAHGVKPFSKYVSGKEDLIAATLLQCDGVSFCSVQKNGLYLRVEMQLSPFAQAKRTQGDMRATRTGKLLSLTVLKGTAQKKSGDEIQIGDTLVAGYIATENGASKQVEVIARAWIACTYEKEWETTDEESAFAQAYLELALSDQEEITQKEITQTGNTFHVKINYVAVQTLNF